MIPPPAEMLRANGRILESCAKSWHLKPKVRRHQNPESQTPNLKILRTVRERYAPKSHVPAFRSKVPGPTCRSCRKCRFGVQGFEDLGFLDSGALRLKGLRVERFKDFAAWGVGVRL